MDRDQYLAAVVENGVDIARTVQTAPNKHVPSCPDWRLRNLGFHIACVMNLWAGIARRASLERRPLGFGMQQPEDSNLEQFVRAEVTALVDVLSDVSDDRPGWTWWGDSTVRWLPRVVAIETMIHRWDATNALGKPATIASALGADGVVEFFDVWTHYADPPPEGLVGSFALEATDVGIRWLVNVGTSPLPTIIATDAVGEASASVRGTAAELLLLLWRRLPHEALTITGNRDFVARFLAYPNLD